MNNILPSRIFPMLACAALVSLSSCRSREDHAKAQEFQGKAGELKQESDRLAVEATALQQKIREAGSEDMTGPKIVETLLLQEKEKEAEGQRLQKLADDLKSANGKLASEQAAFGKKYLKP